MTRGLNSSTYCTGVLSVALRAVVCPWYKRFPLCDHHIAIRPPTVIIQRYFNMSTSDSGRATAKPAAAGAGSDGVAPDNNIGIRERKMTLRKRIKAALKVMDMPAVEAASGAVAGHLLKMSQLAQGVGEGGAVSVYLSMPGELGTSSIISELFKRGKKIYIPKVLGPGSADMRMFPLESEEEVQSFPLTKWKIPEPSKELVLSREDGVLAGDIDVVVVPGMAFDARCNRLGHGKGYYDCFFERIKSSNKEKGRPPPTTMGVCFDEQIVESVPTSSTDVPLDFVFTPSHVFRRDTDTGGC